MKRHNHIMYLNKHVQHFHLVQIVHRVAAGQRVNICATLSLLSLPYLSYGLASRISTLFTTFTCQQPES